MNKNSKFSLLKKILHGVFFLGALRVATRVLGAIKFAVLAILLSPSEIGVYGLVIAILTFMDVVFEIGIQTSLVQAKKQSVYINASWVISLSRGVLIASIIFLFSRAISFFFNYSNLESALKLSSLIPLIKALVNPSVVSLQRKMKFKQEMYYRSFLVLVETLIILSLVYYTRSFIGIIVGLIFTATIEFFLSWIYFLPRPSFVIELGKIRKLLRAGSWITLTSVFNFIYQQGDDLIVGKLLGVQYLGLYQVAYKLATFPTVEVGEIFYKYSFPLLSKYVSNKQKLIEVFAVLVFLIAFLFLPVFGFLFVFADKVVKLLFKDIGEQIVPLVKILLVYGAIRSITGLVSPLFLALKAQKYVMYITFTASFFLCVLNISLQSTQPFGKPTL